MPFLTRLHTVDEGPGRWRLTAPLIYTSIRYGQTITAPTEFVTDYASVPRVPIVFALTGNTGHRAAVIHDWLYRHGAGRWTRKQTDLIFREALSETEPGWRVYAMYAGVRAFGWRAWHGAR